ncbi:hypothetical protein P691DRAFT_802496 [Macrolepiota fuliginosa MF-IS2]|uniref:Uncharacterized protein n=1 Tax=Macrolepiota fuliginosa MF-IS2 TaxID=1400762 RepID=A0A9P6C174_9AGAR|nr:hypothetical protein P691DRAFT_802496 [Macrolepiota fuliginosa MF-IS2]
MLTASRKRQCLELHSNYEQTKQTNSPPIHEEFVNTLFKDSSPNTASSYPFPSNHKETTPSQYGTLHPSSVSGVTEQQVAKQVSQPPPP